MTEQVRRDFVKYSFFKVDPAWRLIPEKERQDSKAQFAEVLNEFSQEERKKFINGETCITTSENILNRSPSASRWSW